MLAIGVRVVLMLFSAWFVSGCGQKGPLYLDKPYEPSSQQKPEPVRKAPAEPTPVVAPSAPN